MPSRNHLIKRLGSASMALAFTLMTTGDARAVERKGFIAGIGFGGGRITCDRCEVFSGPAIELHLGGMLTERAALVFEGAAVAKSVDGDTFTSVVAAGALQYWVFTALYAVALRGYLYARALRDADRWCGAAVARSGFLGGIAFYLSLQVRAPRPPTLLDLPAFLILWLAAAAVPALMDVGVVVRARLQKRADVKVPEPSE